MRGRIAIAVGLLLQMLCAAPSEGSEHFDSERASFALRFRGLVCPYRVFAASVMPGEVLDLETSPSAARPTTNLIATAGQVEVRGAGRWRWTAPSQPGMVYVSVVDPEGVEAITLHVFVLVPYEAMRNGLLNGYQIDPYPSTLGPPSSAYETPRGFLEVTPWNENLRVAPHFRLGQFLCKQTGGYPKYLVLDERLLLKLEMILEEVNRRGIDAPTFEVMSGFRTPWYNRRIGNVALSRHQWGDAADIFVDVHPVDGRMDDLDRNGRSDIGDARLLYDWVEHMVWRPHLEWLPGGLGLYGPSSDHGPFLHVDVRGYGARWGA